jgi:hypothetical protein
MPIPQQQPNIGVLEDQKEREPVAAARYGLSLWTLWAWLASKKIRRWKMGNVTLVSLRELEEFMERSTALAETEEAKQHRRNLAEKRRRPLAAEAVHGRR